MMADIFLAFALVWLPGGFLSIWLWRKTAATNERGRPAMGVRAFYVGVVFSPSVIHAHGDFYVPALFYLFSLFNGALMNALSYGVIPMLVTGILSYGVMYGWQWWKSW